MSKYFSNISGLLFLSLVLIYSCKPDRRQIIKTYPNGNPLVIFNYPDKNNKIYFEIEVFYSNGHLHRKLFVKEGKFIDSMITYFDSGKISLIDSMINPCDTLTRACDAARTIYYENGKIAEQYRLKDGKYNGFSRHFDTHGVIAKEYFLVNDSIKEGQYKEYDRNGKIDFVGTYKNDSLTGFCYYFDVHGDTLKYYNNYKGAISLPYKKWLSDGRTLVGNFATGDNKSVIWNWFDKSGRKVKTKTAHVTAIGFVVPE
ncbi:MAG: hypothetical protein ACHQDF_02030 [Chitinophagales bacterium]